MKKSKILTYSSAAVAFLSCPAANAQIIYTDVEPDHMVGIGDDYPIDLNNDGIPELSIHCTGTWSWTSFGGVAEGFSTIEVKIINYASIAASGDFPVQLNTGDIIDSGLAFTDINPLWLFGGYYDFDGSTDFYFGSSWVNNDGFLAVKFNIDGESHNGWVRLNLHQEAESGLPLLVVKDFAYDTVANEAINVELFSAANPENIILSDIGETNSASDLKCTFDKAFDESTISAYRVILCPGTLPTLAEAETLSSERYTEVMPTGDDLEIIFNDTTQDINGNLLVPDTYYRAVVLSIADGVNAFFNSISFPSNNQRFSLQYASAALYGSLNDDGINTGIDAFNVSFYLYGDDVSEIRIYLADDDYYYEIEDLLPLDSNYYTTATPYFGLHTVSIPPEKLIYTSGSPLLFHSYYAYIITMPDTVNSTFPTLSDEEMYDIFDYANTPEIPIVSVSNLTGTASDVNIQYPKFIDEDLIDEYMIVVVPETSSYDNAMANDLSENRSTHVIPSGADVNVNLLETIRDVDGHFLEPGTTYSVYVTLKKFYDFCTSAKSDTFQLQEPLSISSNSLEANMYLQDKMLIVEFQNPGNATLKIYNSAGALVLIEQVINQHNEIPVENFSAGIYYIILETDDRVSAKKIFIEK